MEAENVEVKLSTLNEEFKAGEGLFAKRDLSVGQIVALYSGMLFDLEQVKQRIFSNIEQE